MDGPASPESNISSNKKWKFEAPENVNHPTIKWGGLLMKNIWNCCPDNPNDREEFDKRLFAGLGITDVRHDAKLLKEVHGWLLTVRGSSDRSRFSLEKRNCYTSALRYIYSLIPGDLQGFKKAEDRWIPEREWIGLSVNLTLYPDLKFNINDK